jgi:hypothetical protein
MSFAGYVADNIPQTDDNEREASCGEGEWQKKKKKEK